MINNVFNSILFWSAWIIIPLLMEIIPAIGGFISLVKKKRKDNDDGNLDYYPEITIMIPVYNSADTLAECIGSISRSDYPDDRIRIYLINNQGQDNSFDVFCQCQKDYPDLIMQWLNAKQGKSKALNMALFSSQGKYIINIDSDGTLDEHALSNMIEKFEADPTIECMTGAIMVEPKLVENYHGIAKVIRKIEFMEYAQAFLAGRNYAAESNSIYTLSGAFSAFRKSAVLSSHMYNTDTICEDTEITFQMRYNKDIKVDICSEAIFYVDPIEDMDKLYTQRQRWQRGSIEVSSMFLKDKMKVKNMLRDPSVRTLVFDHTFAFPRMIWYLALICLLFMNYSLEMIGISVALLYGLYVLVGFLYYLTTIKFLKEFESVRDYYKKQWPVLFLLPVFNLYVFFIRFAGIINSINTNSSWKTRNFREEKEDFKQEFGKGTSKFKNLLDTIRDYVNV